MGGSPHERLRHFAWRCTAADEYVVEEGQKYYNIDQSSRDLPKGELQVGVSDLDQYLRSLMLLGSELDFFPP